MFALSAVCVDFIIIGKEGKYLRYLSERTKVACDKDTKKSPRQQFVNPLRDDGYAGAAVIRD